MSVPSNPGSSRISREDAARAVDALLGFLRARSKQRKAQLFEHDDFLYLHISIRRFPSTSRLNPYRIPLPHTLHPLDPSRTSLCLIVDDSLAETARSTAAAENLPFDSVIPLSELRTDYVPFESRRRLCDSYDIFFAERRIITFLPRLIGNCFFKKKKIPLAVNISRPGWPEAVRQACRSTLLFSSSGTCIGMKVGRVSMDREDIIDNLMASIDGAVDHVPKKWANIRCMYIKAVQSVALPIYQVVPEMGTKIDVGSGGKAEPLDRVVVQARDVKRGVEEKSKKKRVVSKKRKARIHDVDYIGAELVARSDDDDADGAEEKGNHELGREKKKKKKKEGNGKLSKGKKCSIDGDDEDGCREKESGGKFIELGTERKKRKRANKIVNSEVEVHALKDGLAVAPADDLLDGKDLQLKKKVKSKCKRNKGKKGKKENLHGSSEDLENIEADAEVNLMNVDTAIATAADHGDHVNDEVAAADVLLDGKDLQLKKKVESKCKRSKGKKGKKDNLHGSSEVNLMSVDTAVATAADDGDHVDDEVSHVEKRVKNSGKIGKDKKVKKVKKTKL